MNDEIRCARRAPPGASLGARAPFLLLAISNGLSQFLARSLRLLSSEFFIVVL